MNKITEYNFSDLYGISSGISTTKTQAGHGCPFVSFSTVFNNYFLPDELSDLMDTSEKEQEIYSIKEGDIFLTRTSETVNELAMSCIALKDYPCATFSGFTKRLRAKTQGIAYHKYLGFYLRGYLFRQAVTNHSIMTLRSSFNEEIFSLLKLYLPEYTHQVKIGDFLYAIEQKIQLNIIINNELEKYAKLLYDFWFMQFDFPNAEGKPYRASGGEMIYNKQLNREIPKGWKVNTLKSLTNIVLGGTPNTANNEYWYGKFNWLNSGEVSSFPIVSTVLKVTQKGINNSSTKLMPIGTTVVSITGNIRTSVLGVESCANQSVVGIYETKNITHAFIYPTINNLIKKYTMISTGNCQTHINKGTIEDTIIVLPPEEVMNKYNSICLPVYKKILESALEIKEFNSLRDFLLPLLMNGQVSVEKSKGKADIKEKTKSIKPVISNDTRYMDWKTQVGLAARGDIDEQTLRNIYEAMDTDDR